MNWANHLIILPILLPVATAAALIPIDDRNRTLKGVLSFASTVVLFFAAIILVALAASPQDAASSAFVYMLGNWPAPFGIVLVLDRLSALMLALSAVLGLAAQVYAMARWHTAGYHFHSLFQLLLAGLNGAFLTGDLFNLFVFFEMMLAASYGLLLHGSGLIRVKAGLHYIAVNLAASSLFLIGVSLIYGATGTLNMADLAVRIMTLGPESRMLMEAGAALLGIAFLVKAGMWPLGFWLPTAYSAATPPVAAMFAILTKVGIYVILRLSLLLFGDEAGMSAGFGQNLLLYGGLLTIAFGAIGVLASQAMGRIAGYSILVSSGTLLAAIGLGNSAVIGGALFYLVSSTLTICAFFLLIELVERGRDAGADVLAVTMEAYGDLDEDEEEKEVGVAVPGTLAVLGLCFCACAILMSGLPPLSGFLAKFAILHELFNEDGFGGNMPITAGQWIYVALLILSGLAAMIAMNRIGIRTFWTSIEGTIPRVFLIEITPFSLLLLATVFLSLQAGPAMRYMDAAAKSLADPTNYIDRVLSAPRVAPAEAIDAMRYWFPYPLLSFALMLFWLLINESLSPAQILLGAALGISHAWLMVNLRPTKTHTKRAWLVARLTANVIVDVAKSNFMVMGIILRRRNRPVNSGFVPIDITLQDENALAILACILTATPGSAWLEFDSQTSVLLLHVLDIENGTEWAEMIRTRYEAPLKELFE